MSAISLDKIIEQITLILSPIITNLEVMTTHHHWEDRKSEDLAALDGRHAFLNLDAVVTVTKYPV